MTLSDSEHVIDDLWHETDRGAVQVGLIGGNNRCSIEAEHSAGVSQSKIKIIC